MPTERPGALPGVLTVLLAASLFGTLGVLSRQAYAEGLEPFSFVAWRAGVGALALWAAMLVARRWLGRGSPLVGWSAMPARMRRALLITIVAGTLLNMAAFFAFERITIALALLCFYTYPAIVAAVSVALGRERLDAARLVALLLALAGMVAVVVGGAAGGTVQIDPLGLAAAFTAAACQVVFVLVSREYGSIPTDQAMATILAGTGVIGAIVTILAEGPGQLAAPLAAAPLLLLLIGVGIFTAAVPSSLFLAGIRRLGGIRTGIVMLAEPVVGVILAAVFLAEGVTPLQVVGGATILVAAVLVQRDPTPEIVPVVTPVPGAP
jgi:drug/metabolite transporter (DMT)-like permease